MRPVYHSRELLPALRRDLAECDASWPIAPESGGELERLCDAVLTSGRILLGSRPEAVRLTASKYATLNRLAQHALPVVPAVPGTAVLAGAPVPPMPWVIKPDDGAGCDETFVVYDHAELRRRIARAPSPSRVLVQPYVAGVDGSLSLLVEEGGCTVLARNRQQIGHKADAFYLQGCVVNGLDFDPVAATALAQAIARAIPGLWGYVGVDLLLTPAGPQVLEINPRLTTSYVGLTQSLGVNAAGLVLDLLRPANERAALPSHGRPVTIALAAEHVA